MLSEPADSLQGCVVRPQASVLDNYAWAHGGGDNQNRDRSLGWAPSLPFEVSSFLLPGPSPFLTNGCSHPLMTLCLLTLNLPFLASTPS